MLYSFLDAMDNSCTNGSHFRNNGDQLRGVEKVSLLLWESLIASVQYYKLNGLDLESESLSELWSACEPGIADTIDYGLQSERSAAGSIAAEPILTA